MLDVVLRDFASLGCRFRASVRFRVREWGGFRVGLRI